MIYGLSIYFTGALTEDTHILDILALRFLISATVLWVLKTFKIIKINIGVKNIFTKKHRQKGIYLLLLTGLFEPILYMFFDFLTKLYFLQK